MDTSNYAAACARHSAAVERLSELDEQIGERERELESLRIERARVYRICERLSVAVTEARGAA